MKSRNAPGTCVNKVAAKAMPVSSTGKSRAQITCMPFDSSNVWPEPSVSNRRKTQAAQARAWAAKPHTKAIQAAFNSLVSPCLPM